MGHPHGSADFSAELEKRADHIARRTRVLRYFALVLFLLGTGLYTVSHVINPNPSATTSATADFLTLAGTVFLIAAIVVTLVLRKLEADSIKRLARMARLQQVLEPLQKRHPELVALQQAMELVNEEKDEASGRRDFWVSVLQNFIFLVLGFLLSYVLARLGWLR